MHAKLITMRNCPKGFTNGGGAVRIWSWALPKSAGGLSHPGKGVRPMRLNEALLLIYAVATLIVLLLNLKRK
jgi:hypothetical protein